MEDEDLKFYVWARKIDEEVEHLEEFGTEEEIIEYLLECAKLRDEFLGPDDLTQIEEYYTEKINEYTFEKYGVSDPIYNALFD